MDTAVVCAVDSLLDARSLEWLSYRRPLRSMRQADGAIAGEAAAALVLSAVPGSRRNGALVLAGVGFGDEPAARDPAQPLRGDGLTAATKAALVEAGLEMHDLGLRMASGADGERELKEHTLSLTRLLRVRLEQLPMWLCAETLGHVGAATGLVQIAWAHETMVRGDLPGTVISSTAFAYDGRRATALLTCLR
ncbi:MAG: hypothetical protein KC492_08365 [Myxococcales bacterium]|nr:hypothetical protein [Myxococcales bacterium]